MEDTNIKLMMAKRKKGFIAGSCVAKACSNDIVRLFGRGEAMPQKKGKGCGQTLGLMPGIAPNWVFVDLSPWADSVFVTERRE